MQPNNTGINENSQGEDKQLFSLQAIMQLEMHKFINLPETASLSLDEIYRRCNKLEAVKHYVGESQSYVRSYIVRIAISDALRAWIDNKMMNEARSEARKEQQQEKQNVV